MASKIYWILYDMASDHPTVEEVQEMLQTESGRAYLLEPLAEMALNGDEEAQEAVFDLIHIMEAA